MNPSLTAPGLEAVYDTLAQTLDKATEARSELLLVKLVLLLARELGDADRFAELARTAMNDL